MREILTASLSVLLYVLSMAIIFHWKKQNRVLRSLLTIGASLVPIYLMIYFLLPGRSSSIDLLNGLMTYGALFYCLSHFIVVIHTSLTISLLMLLAKATDGQLTREQINHSYPYAGILAKRMKRLVEAKYLFEESGAYHLTPKGHCLAKIALTLKHYFHCYPGG